MEKFDVNRALLSIGAVFLRPDEPFTWASGIKSPIYCDNRLILTAPEVRANVEAELAGMIRREFPEAEVLMGTATAGIAHAAIAAHILGLPMGYVRSGNKDHGRQNRIEGRLNPGEKVVVVEDLISTGGSALEAVEALREAGAEVLGIAALFTYGMEKGKKRLAEHDVRAVCLTDFDKVVAAAAEDGAFPASYVPALMAFRDNPDDGSWQEALK
ncbi:MAG TPA: orotate phosphoribosyltransferase [Candidatus Scatomorpha merdigallinarum]|nr:orotate phosphoribosyltransferase [Candidatus Scatomorpha merdigallinarum]